MAIAPQPQPRFETIRGTGRFLAAQTPPDSSSSESDEQGVTLNFVNADIRDVAKAVLGDLLKLNYQVAGDVQGAVTIQTSRPLKTSDVLPTFEQALNLNNMALVKSGGTIQIMTREDAQKAASVAPIVQSGTAADIGYGVEVVPLQFISVNQMRELIAPLLPNADMLQADPVRNVLFIRGTQIERATILDNIALFDVDWLGGMSFTLYTPQYMSARELARELQEVIGGPGGPLQGILRFVPIERLNAVLVVSTQPKYLDDLAKWTERLDRPGQGSDRRLMVYHVQNGRAADLAAVLARALSLADGAASGPAAAAVPSGGSLADLPMTAEQTRGGQLGLNIAELGGVRITADEINNALLIFSTPKAYEAIREALRQLDIEPLQVLLEAAIAEVRLIDRLRYGVQYLYTPDSEHEVVLSTSATKAIASLLPGLSYTFDDGVDIKIILDALSSVTDVEILSSPQIMVLNNQTATLQVGDQVPIVTEQAVSTITTGAPVVNSVRYQDTGVILKVTPRVNQGGLVMMDISQEVSEVTSTTSSSINSPTIQQRKINSTVAVRDSETIAIGGLITSNRTRGRQGVPLLQSIPAFGALFRSTNREAEKTELIVLITPHVVNNVEKARAVTQELRQKLKRLEPVLRQAQ